MAALLITSSLAAADVGKASDILKKVSSSFLAPRANSYEKFRILHEYRFASAEASGSLEAVRECVDFLHRHPKEWERRHNRSYYLDRTDGTLALALERKLTNPKPRDINTRAITVAMRERLDSPSPIR